MKYLIYDKIRLGVAVLLCFCTALQTDAKVKLPALISDGMDDPHRQKLPPHFP